MRQAKLEALNVVATVSETYDYDKFKPLSGNRPVNPIHVLRLKESFQAQYLMSPILVNEKDEVIDGQHRLCAARELGYPIRYIVANGYALNEVQRLNTHGNNWTKSDYLNAYCELGYPNYITFRKFMNRFPDFGISAAESLLSLQTADKKRYYKAARSRNRDGEVFVRTFKEGNFEIPDYERSLKLAQNISKIKPYYEGFNRRFFVVTMVSLSNHPEFDFNRFFDRLKANASGLYNCTNVSQYKAAIELVYNFRSRDKVNLRF